MIYKIFLFSCFVTLASAQGFFEPRAGDEQTGPRTIFVPQVGHGGGFQTGFTFVDLSNTTNRISVRAFDNDGNPINLLSNGPSPFGERSAEQEIGIEIGPLGTAVAETFTGDSPAVSVGYAVIEAEAPVGVEVVFRNFAADGRLLTTTSVLPQALTPDFSFIAFANDFALSGVALLNPASNGQSANIRLQLFNRFGMQVAETTLILAAGEKIAKLIDESDLFPQLASENFTGSIEVQSDVPLAVTAIRLEGAESFFTTQTIQPSRNVP